MALKGTTKIELTNVKTGEREVIEKDNLVTNAVPDLLQLNPFLFRMEQGYVEKTFDRDNFIPICPNLIGGILLYENTIPEDPDKYYAQSDNPLIGYSSSDVNGTEETKRGSMNQTESGPLDTGDGYRFVFDFDTSQGNGKISCIGLTSKWGGQAGYSSLYDYNENIVKASSNTVSIGTYSSGADYFKNVTSVCMIDPDRNMAYAVRISGEKQLTVAEIRFPLTAMGLAIGTKLPVVKQETISTSVFGLFGSSSTYAGFCHDGEGNIWGFQHSDNGSSGNKTGNATINWIKINPMDWSFTEGTWTIPYQLSRMGYQYESGTKYYVNNEILVHEGCLYCFSYDGYAVYKINVTNPTDVQEFRFNNGGIMRRSGKAMNTAKTAFNVIGNVVGFRGGYILGNTAYRGSVYTDYIQAAYDYAGTNLRIGPLLLLFNVTTGTTHTENSVKMAIVNPYLATINNLQTPVEKTADKTMKITYILREES